MQTDTPSRQHNDDAPDKHPGDSAAHDEANTPAADEASLRERQQLEDEPAAGSAGGDDGFYTGTSGQNTPRHNQSGWGRVFTRRRVVGGLVGILMAGSGFGLFGFLAVWQSNNVAEMLAQRLQAPLKNAVEKRVEHFFYQYLANKYLPGLSACSRGSRSVVKSTDVCPDFDYRSRGLAGKLYSSSSPYNRAVKKMLANGDIVIEYHSNDSRAGNPFTLKHRGQTIGDFNSTNATELRNTMDRFEMRRFLRSRMFAETEGQSFWRKRTDRFHMRRAMRRLNVPRFFIPGASEKIDEVSGRRKAKIGAIKREMIRRAGAILPTRYFVYMLCLQDPDRCTPDIIDDEVRRLGREVASETGDALTEITDSLNKGDTDNIIMRTIIRRMVTKFAGEQTGQRVAQAIPVIGQIIFAVQIADMVDRVDDGVFEEEIFVRIQRDLLQEQYVGVMSTLRTSNDEAKAGDVTLENHGENAALLENYTQSKLYQKYYAGNSTPTSTRECRDGPMPEGEYVCPEEQLDYRPPVQELIDNPVAQKLHSAWNASYEKCLIDPSGGLAHGIVDAITPGDLVCPLRADTAIRWIINGVNTLFDAVLGPVADVLVDLTTSALKGVGLDVQQITEDVVSFVFKHLFPTPLTPEALAGGHGALIFDAYHAGQEIVVQQFLGGGQEVNGTAFGAGAPEISDQEAAREYARIEQEDMEEFAQQPLWNRVFDTSSQYSVASRALMKIDPNIGDNLGNTVATLPQTFANVFTGLFGTIFGQKTFALQPAGAPASPHVVQQHKIPDEWLTADAEEITEERCAQLDQEWLDSYDKDTATYKKSNQCMFERFWTSILNGESDEQGPQLARQPTGGGAIGPSDPNGCPAKGTTVPAGDPNLVKIPGADTIVHSCIAANVQSMYAAAAQAGITFGGGGWRSNQRQIELRKQNCGTTPYDIYQKKSSQCSPPTARPGSSRHESGTAIDLTCNGLNTINISARPGTRVCFNWLQAHAATYGLKNLPSENWHWSIDGT